MNLAVFFVRAALGAALLVSGALKVGHAPALAAAIAGFRLLPAAVIPALATLLPLFEIFVGVYLVIGLFTKVSAYVAAAQFALYGAVIASAVVRSIPASCGCFGPSDTATADWPHVGFDLALAVAALFVARFAPGAFAMDRKLVKSA
jgi:uncharacterized membrane protein YphA (DoxX/SURF4 family)